MDLALQLLATGLVVGSLYALCALGWGLIYGTTLHFHVAHGAVFTLAAYFVYVGQKLLHLPLGVACVLAVAGAALAGLLIDLLVYQRLEARGAVRTTVFIASLGVLIVLENLVALAYKEAKNTFTLPGLGKLVLVNRKARMGRNPQTGEAIKIPAKRVVKFRIAKAAKDAILGKR